MFDNILCKFYCLGLYKRLNSSRHHVHWLASKSDSISQGKVQSQKLPIIYRLFPIYVLSVIRSCCCIFSPSNSIHVGDCWKNRLLYGLFWANFKPKIEWAPNVFWGGSEEVMCSLLRGKSHGGDSSSKPFMSEWELDVVFGFVEWTFKELNVDFLEMGCPTLKL